MLNHDTNTAARTVFVDAARRGDAEADGTAERPFGRIQRAVDQAGENGRVMVAPGLYRECVRLAPGQSLLGLGPDLPVIAPRQQDQKRRPHAVLALAENTRLVRVAVRATEKHQAAVRVTPSAGRGGTVTLEGCRLSAAGRLGRGLTLRLTAGRRLDALLVRDCAFATAGWEGHGLFLRLEGGALGRLELAGCRVRARGLAACGLFACLDKGAALDSFMVRGNRITTDGKGAEGVLLESRENSFLARLVVRGNRIATADKQYASAVCLDVRESARLARYCLLADNRVVTRGEDAHGLRVDLGRGRLPLLVLRGNRVFASGMTADGLVVLLDDESRLDALRLRGNRVRVSGPAYGDEKNGWVGAAGIALKLFPPDALLRRVTARGNVVVTRGLCADALSVTLFGRWAPRFEPQPARLEHVALLDNVLVTRGKWADGVGVALGEGSVLDSLSATGNRILTRGWGADGMSLNILDPHREGDVPGRLTRPWSPATLEATNDLRALGEGGGRATRLDPPTEKGTEDAAL